MAMSLNSSTSSSTVNAAPISNKKLKTNEMGYSDGYMKTVLKDANMIYIHMPPIPSMFDTNLIVEASETCSTSSHPNHPKEGKTTVIPESVLQYERQIRKQQAAKRASTPLDESQLDIIYNDDHIVVVNKPSGVLSVPGIHSNPSMLTILYDRFRDEIKSDILKEHMIVHRLDMDTSGIVIYAKSKEIMLLLQQDFRERKVDKVYEALICGHLDSSVEKIKIDLPLQRDHAFPPFMRIATYKSEADAKQVVKDLNTNGFKKLIKKNAKPSVTLMEVIKREYIEWSSKSSVDSIENKGEGIKIPVTRVRLEPVTGRTHQLRVHCAALGHPIVGDPAYSLLGEANMNGGLTMEAIQKVMSNTASIDLQLKIEDWVKAEQQFMCLHARRLELKHPMTKEDMVFEKLPHF